MARVEVDGARFGAIERELCHFGAAQLIKPGWSRVGGVSVYHLTLMYAVIKTGGKQYKVTQGQTLQVEKLGAAVGDVVTFPAVMVVDGDKVIADKASLAGSKVSAKVIGEVKGEKIVGFMYKAKARARKRWGHRQQYTVVEVTGISA
jgi:large subunit ribosomal protein L21